MLAPFNVKTGGSFFCSIVFLMLDNKNPPLISWHYPFIAPDVRAVAIPCATAHARQDPTTWPSAQSWRRSRTKSTWRTWWRAESSIGQFPHYESSSCPRPVPRPGPLFSECSLIGEILILFFANCRWLLWFGLVKNHVWLGRSRERRRPGSLMKFT